MNQNEWPTWEVRCGNCGGNGIGTRFRNANLEWEALPCRACNGKGSIFVSSPTPILEPVYTSGIQPPIETVSVEGLC